VWGVKYNPSFSFSNLICYFTVNGFALFAKVIYFIFVGSSFSFPKSIIWLYGLAKAATAVAFLID